VRLLPLFAVLLSTSVYAASPLSSIMPASTSEKEARLLTCGRGFIGTPCEVTLETSGFSSGALVEFFQREDLGRLIKLKTVRLDASRKATLTLKFSDTAPFNLLALVIENHIATALDGAVIDVYPDKNQLGEQFTGTVSIGIAPTYSEPEEDDGESNSDDGGGWD